MPKAAVPRSGVPREGLGTVQAGVSGDGVQAASTTPPIMVFAAAAARSASDAAGVAVGAGLPATVGDTAAPVWAGTGDAVPAPVRAAAGDAVLAPSSPPPAHAARARAIPARKAANAGLNTIPAMSITPSWLTRGLYLGRRQRATKQERLERRASLSWASSVPRFRTGKTAYRHRLWLSVYCLNLSKKQCMPSSGGSSRWRRTLSRQLR